MSWQGFGTSGYIKRPPTQINHLLHRAETNWDRNGFVKSFVRPDRVVLENVNDSHYFPTYGGDTVNENREIVTCMFGRIAVKTICLNHYVFRSWQDYWEVKGKRTQFGCPLQLDEAFFDCFNKNDVFDNEISKRFGHLIE